VLIIALRRDIEYGMYELETKAPLDDSVAGMILLEIAAYWSVFKTIDISLSRKDDIQFTH